MLAVAEVERRRAGGHRRGQELAEALEAGKDEVAILAERTADRFAELVGDVLAERQAGAVVLRVVGVQIVVADEVEERPVPAVGPGLENGVDAAAAGARDGGVV